jgi:hypothetical protein
MLRFGYALASMIDLSPLTRFEGRSAMANSERSERREEEVSPPPPETDVVRKKIDDMAWGNYQSDVSSGQLQRNVERQDGSDGKPDDNSAGLTEAWSRGESNAEAEVELRPEERQPSREEIDDAAWANANAASSSGASASESVVKEARVAEARRMVEEASENRDESSQGSQDASELEKLRSSGSERDLRDPALPLSEGRGDLRGEWIDVQSKSALDQGLSKVVGVEGLEHVPLSTIDTSDRQISPSDFGKGYSPSDLEWAFKALNEVVLPAVADGEGPDYFQRRDEEEGLVGTRSYSDTFSGFLGGDDVIRLNWVGDRYEVANGYHRIWVANQMGLDSVPARVVR